MLTPIKTKCIEHYEFELGEYNLLRLLEPNMHPNAKNIKVTIDIPSGGDYSGMRLDLKEIGTIRVSYDVEND